MIRLLAAFFRLQVRQVANSWTGGRSQDPAMRLARQLEMTTPVIFSLLFVPGALALTGLAFWNGREMGTTGEPSLVGLTLIRVLLLSITVTVICAPLFRGLHGGVSTRTRFLLLPIARRTLHLAEIAQGLAEPWLALLIPPTLALAAGIASAGALTAALVVSVAGLMLFAGLAALSGLASFAIHLVLRHRRLTETAYLAAVLVAAAAALLPAGLWRIGGDRIFDVTLPSHPDQILPAFLRPLPADLYARAVAAAVEGRIADAWLRVGTLTALALGVFVISSWTHARILASPATSAFRRSRSRPRLGGLTLPGVTQAEWALALASARSVLRAVRVQVQLFVVPALMVLAVSVVAEAPVAARSPTPVSLGILLFVFGLVLSTALVQGIATNQYAVDGNGLTRAFLLPLDDRQIVRGKAFGVLLLALGSTLPLTGLAFVLGPGGSPWLWLAGMLSAVSVWLVILPIDAILAGRLPRRADLGQLGKGGDPHPAGALLGVAAAMVLWAPPLFLAGVALRRGSPAGALLGTLAWAGVAWALSRPLWRAAVGALRERRDGLGLVVGERG